MLGVDRYVSVLHYVRAICVCVVDRSPVLDLEAAEFVWLLKVNEPRIGIREGRRQEAHLPDHTAASGSKCADSLCRCNRKERHQPSDREEEKLKLH